MRRTVLAMAAAVLVCSCTQRNVAIPAVGSISSPSNPTTAASNISITIPQAPQTSSSARRAAYISTASNSIVLTPQGQPPIVMPLTTTTPGCRTLNGARICTFRISLPTGAYTMRVALFATVDGTGVPLAVVSTPTTIVANTTNNIDFTLNAVVASIAVSLAPDGNFTAGTAATKTIVVAAFDAGGGTIIVGSDALVDSSGSPVAIRFGDTDSSGTTSIAPTVAGSTPSILSYNGGTPNSGAITAAAVNLSSTTVAAAQASFNVLSGVARCGSARRFDGTNSCSVAFLSFPLTCGVPPSSALCSVQYKDGAYSAGRITSVLDHQMVRSSPGGFLQYGTLLDGGGDGKIVAFNGEHAEGGSLGNTKDTIVCIRGTNGGSGATPPPALHLATSPTDPNSDMVAHPGGCNPAWYASYDEHPGYDYVAALGSEVKAAAGGYVVDNGDYSSVTDPDGGQASARCVPTNITGPIPHSLTGACASFGYVGIDHGNGYISQYGHLQDVNTQVIKPGHWVDEGALIGHSGEKGVPNNPHLHFEVIYLIPGEPSDRSNPDTYNPQHWTVVDPYGWVAGLPDPKFYPLGDPLESFQKYHIFHFNLWK